MHLSVHHVEQVNFCGINLTNLSGFFYFFLVDEEMIFGRDLVLLSMGMDKGIHYLISISGGVFWSLISQQIVIAML
jgi:hypothetical protein